MAQEDDEVVAFEAGEREPGESVLVWVHAVMGASAGTAILTDRRLCFRAGDGIIGSIPVLGRELRYLPEDEGETLIARFETEHGGIAFAVVGEEEQRHLGNLLGNLAELREAQDKLERAGLSPLFAPPAEEGAESVSAVYRLIRLKELLNQGLFSDIEFALQRQVMIADFLRQAES